MCALVAAPTCVDAIYDFHAERYSRLLWVHESEADALPYPEVRSAKLARRAKALASGSGNNPAQRLRLGYNVDTYEAEQRLKAAKKTALSTKLEPPPRKDIYVKGAQDWEKNCWKVWDKKKMQEEARKDKYSTAMTSYLGGSKLVHRFEPPAVTQCAHCDIGGGLHPLRRCMGCMAVAYCCRMHQQKHWEWHKHICFAIRAANNLEAKRGEGAGWCKLRPRRWRRPPIENGAIVETNVRARWANWKQFYTNGAQSMLNQMGDGGPFVFKEWDEGIASMAMCEEATFVFSVGATQRAMMPFVACRKAPPGTVLVCEVGLINVKRNGGRDQEVNDFLTAKFVAEARQKKLDRLDEQKFMRLRMKQDRADKADVVMKLLKSSIDSTAGADALESQKDSNDFGAEVGANPPAAGGNEEVGGAPQAADSAPASPAPKATGHTASPAKPPASAPKDDDVEEWEESPMHDYEGFGEADDFFALPGDAAEEPLNLPSAFDDDDFFKDSSAAGKSTGGTASRAVAAEEAAPRFVAQETMSKREPFIAASTFEGAKQGYVFKKDKMGLGYYVDVAASRAPWMTETDIAGVGDNYAVAPWDATDGGGSAAAPQLSKPAAKANDPWATVDAVDTSAARVADRIAAQKHELAAAKAAAEKVKKERERAASATKIPAKKAATTNSIRPILESLGLGDKAAAFEAAALTDAAALASLQQSDPTALANQLSGLGLKMGQRQKFILALGSK